ncbi:MAG: hypothetical protein LBC86_06925 [Oscillospiraceae bacterium]|jgi:DNA-directed RNA polymerase subunit RPC12/RpoP|nr:hypothetical protein [Oscillospiraceae bacterium]
MSCFQLSELREILTPEQIKLVDDGVKTLSRNHIITLSNFSSSVCLDAVLTAKVLKKLVDLQILSYQTAIRCPECGILIKEVDSLNFEAEYLCYGCEEMVLISTDNIEVIYRLAKYPFVERQQIKVFNNSEKSVAGNNDSLTYLLENNILDFNALFFSPTEAQYEELLEMYNRVFPNSNNKSNKEKGDDLNDFIVKLFNICKHFSVSSAIWTSPNQIDVYTRNKLYIPGISGKEVVDGFHIECKNEANTPKAEYMNKLHSILCTTEKRLGIVVSKSPAPKTFVRLANKIFLRDKIVIIWIDKNDLFDIIKNKLNLLEVIARKIDEVKFNATKDLRELKLYEA